MTKGKTCWADCVPERLDMIRTPKAPPRRQAIKPAGRIKNNRNQSMGIRIITPKNRMLMMRSEETRDSPRILPVRIV